MALPPRIVQLDETDAISEACRAHSITTIQFHTLQGRSSAAKRTAYCPYSRFRVGATILTQNGHFIDGANVENASYPVGTCAERVALGKGVVDRHIGKEEDGKKVIAIAVSTDISPPASPCGMCRQFIREFCELSTPIFMFDKDGAFVVMRLEQLLPMSFGPEALPPPGSLQARH